MRKGVTMNERLDLAVLESRWWETSNDSVRGLFDMLAGMRKDNPFAYHYEMFNNADSLKELIPRVSEMQDVHNIYIAAHGAEDGSALVCSGGSVSRTVLANILKPIHARRLYGLFLGCCGVGLQTEWLLLKETKLTWVAGYTESVDWVHSSAMDLFFWHAYYNSSVCKSNRKEERVVKMLSLLLALHVRVPYMFDELGFRVSLSVRPGVFFTYPDDYETEIRETRPRIQEVISRHPSNWP